LSIIKVNTIQNANGTTGITFAANGQMTLANTPLQLTGGQIQFPGTQIASADANTLDDYEEGSWTPTVVGASSAGTTTYTTQLGSYTKIGRLVFARAEISYTSATGTGTMRISLPFSAGSSGVGSIMVDSLNWSGGTYLVLFTNIGDSYLRIFGMTDDSAWVSQDVVNETVAMHISITYQV
jgi:hypothetical protein